MINFLKLADLMKEPKPYEDSEGNIWTDEHIAKEMLISHLDPDTDAASYKPKKIEAICNFITKKYIKEGSNVIDLGCGPGLYATELAKYGISVTGVDQSVNSISYARDYAKKNNINNKFIVANYLDTLDLGLFDAAMIISEDYGVMSYENRKRLLANIHSYLKPNGYFIFDISSISAWNKRLENSNPSWHLSDGGFWRPHQHLVLEKTFFYPDESAVCGLVVVCDSEDNNGIIEDQVKAYRIYQTYFTPLRIEKELNEAGFEVVDIYSNLDGEPLLDSSEQLGIISRRK